MSGIQEGYEGGCNEGMAASFLCRCLAVIDWYA